MADAERQTAKETMLDAGTLNTIDTLRQAPPLSTVQWTLINTTTTALTRLVLPPGMQQLCLTTCDK